MTKAETLATKSGHNPPKSVPERPSAEAWTTYFPIEYESAAQRTLTKRQRRRQMAVVQTTQNKVVDPDSICNEMVFVDMRRQKQRMLREITAERMKAEGSLRSDEHPLLMLFCAKLPRRKNLRVGEDKGQSLQPDSKLIGLDYPYVESNRIVGGVLRVDLDDDIDTITLMNYCSAEAVPPPNIVVGHFGPEGRFVRPHLIWLLHDSVPLACPFARFSNLRMGVLRGLTKAFVGIGADPRGLLNNHRHKNPLSKQWDYAILAEAPYDLGELRRHVDITAKLKTWTECRAGQNSGKAVHPDHPDAVVATMSNAFFAELAGWARREVVAQRRAGVGELAFAEQVAAKARRLAADFGGCEQMALRTAAKVAQWTWNKYRVSKSQTRATADADDLARRHEEGGRKAAAKRKSRTREDLVTATTGLATQLGRMPRQIEVVRHMRAPTSIYSERTVRRHWPAIAVALANRTFAVEAM